MDAKTLCLGALMHKEASGYEIRKLFEDGPFNAVHDVSFGSIYPALTALLERGWVTCYVAEQDGRPDKKVYDITPIGRDAFLDAISTTPAPDKMRSEMLFILSFGDYLSKTTVLALIDKYIADYEVKLSAMQECGRDLDDHPVRQLVHDFGTTMYETAIGFLRKRKTDLMNTSETAGNAGERLAAVGGGR